jgi:RNA polymerase sigma-70 factor (ECF subfamily)
LADIFPEKQKISTFLSEVGILKRISYLGCRCMSEIPLLVDNRVLRPAQTALALNLVSKMDLLRLKAIARVYARGLATQVTWEDLLQEALTRVIAGSRRKPEGITMVAFVAGILRSLRADYMRRATRESGGTDALHLNHERGSSRAISLMDPAPGPERTLTARQELHLIRKLFADDQPVLQIIDGLADGLSAEQIRVATGRSKIEYDSARKRMRRVLLREGLSCESK